MSFELVNKWTENGKMHSSSPRATHPLLIAARVFFISLGMDCFLIGLTNGQAKRAIGRRPSGSVKCVKDLVPI